jgi:hypothetical protein
MLPRNDASESASTNALTLQATVQRIFKFSADSLPPFGRATSHPNSCGGRQRVRMQPDWRSAIAD